jgi:hypothetical protein
LFSNRYLSDESGWEWGYWLSDVVTARASWNPLLNEKMVEFSKHQQCLTRDKDRCTNQLLDIELGNYKERDDQWEAFSLALLPFTRIFGQNLGHQLNSLLVKLTRTQSNLLVLGEIDGQPCPNIAKLTGIAYLSGNDPWIDLPRMLGLPLLQPNKVRMKDMNDKDWRHALNLLEVMDKEFTKLADEMSDIYNFALDKSNNNSNNQSIRNDNNLSAGNNNRQEISDVKLNQRALNLLGEIDDCFRMIALRSSQVNALYKSRDNILSALETVKANYQRQARSMIQEASVIVSKREKHYRVPWERIASWRDNPTVYRFGYLWSVHSLYYWWRDQGLAEQGSLQSELSPCYLNRMDAAEIAVGWGKYTVEVIRYLINRYSPFTNGYPLEFINCFAPPAKEYKFPKDLYH